MLNNKRNLWILNRYAIVLTCPSHSRSKQHKIKRNISKEVIDNIRYVIAKTQSYKGNDIGIVVNSLNIDYFAKSTEIFNDNTSKFLSIRLANLAKEFLG